MVREETGLSLSRACELAGVSRASVYYRPVPVDEETLMLQSLVDRLYMDFPYYGTRRVSWHLRRLGHDVGRDRARSLMAAVNRRTVHPGPRTSKPGAGHEVHPYLLGDMREIAPGQVICSDITYIPVRGGYLYLVAIMDWSSRFVLSWELDNTLEVGLKRERAHGGAGAARDAGDLEHRPGQPVHERVLPWRAARGRSEDQHGRPGSVDRQPLHRAAVEVAEVRGGVPGGAGGRSPCAARDRRMAGPLQPSAPTHGVQREDARRGLLRRSDIPSLGGGRVTAPRQCPPPRAPAATRPARAAAGIGAVHGSGIDHSCEPIDHKLPARAFIQQETPLTLPSNCLNDPDHLNVPLSLNMVNLLQEL